MFKITVVRMVNNFCDFLNSFKNMLINNKPQLENGLIRFLSLVLLTRK